VAAVDSPTQGVFVDMASQEISTGIANPTGTFADTELGRMVSAVKEWTDPVNLLTKDLPPLQQGLINTGREAAELANKVRGLVDPSTPPFSGPLIRSGSTGRVYEIATGQIVPVGAGGTVIGPGGTAVPVSSIPTDTSLLTSGGSGFGGGGGALEVPYVRSDLTGQVYETATGDRLAISNGSVTLPTGQVVPLVSIPLESQVTGAGGGGGTTPFLSAVQAQAGGVNPFLAFGLVGLAVILLRRR
jgi:hypothetical protein